MVKAFIDLSFEDLYYMFGVLRVAIYAKYLVIYFNTKNCTGRGLGVAIFTRQFQARVQITKKEKLILSIL